MEVIATTAAARDTDADTVVVGVFEGKDVAHDLEGAPLQALLEAGEARRSFTHVALAHAEGKRWLLVGLGARDDFDAERARAVAATAAGRLGDLGTRVLCWEVPHHVDADVVEALVEGTLLATYRFDRFRRAPEEPHARLERLIVSDHHDRSAAAEAGRVVGEAQNAARDLANTPANVMTPAALGERAQELAREHAAVSATVEGRAEIEARGMGAFAAVARGTHAEPALITVRYEPAGASGPLVGLVGKAVTFDSGGLSIKPAASMVAMKYDMAGGAAVLEAVGAIARLGLPVRMLAVVGATENLIDGSAMKPGDVVRTKAGLTVEVNNTDAEGRLVLADCLAYAVEEGAERLVDVATLTGAILSALGRTHAGLIGDDDAWCAAVVEAGRRSGEIVWRLPLHPETAELVKGTVGDLVNAVESRVAGSITAAELLVRFTGDVPWAHLDIAGVAWDSGKAYAPKAASGWGVRLLVELVRALA
ncbi:MAG: leucyl aminopeptidase [Solirubrobacteraceae bacterium]